MQIVSMLQLLHAPSTVLYVPSTVCTKYCTVCAKYCVHKVLYVPSTVCTKYCTVCAKYCVHKVLYNLKNKLFPQARSAGYSLRCWKTLLVGETCPWGSFGRQNRTARSQTSKVITSTRNSHHSQAYLHLSDDLLLQRRHFLGLWWLLCICSIFSSVLLLLRLGCTLSLLLRILSLLF